MPENIEQFKEWVESLRQDIETLKRVVENEAVDREARKHAAAALGYVITRMDLVPDWEPSVGVLDDVMVLRVLMSLASRHGVDQELEGKTLVEVGRLTNEAEKIEAFLGGDLYARLRAYCARLPEEAVRGCAPGTIASDARAREVLFQQVEDELRRLPPAPFQDPEALQLKFTSYLHHKLK